MSSTAFSSLHLKPAMLKNLASLGYAEMTPIQAHSLPPILAGKDLIAKAKTGSGKTAAFGIGLLTGLDATALRLQALVLCPTRELADQVAKELRRLARFNRKHPGLDGLRRGALWPATGFSGTWRPRGGGYSRTSAGSPAAGQP